MTPIPTTAEETIEALAADRLVRYATNKPAFDRVLSFTGDDIASNVHQLSYDRPEVIGVIYICVMLQVCCCVNMLMCGYGDMCMCGYVDMMMC